jgi:hypothetical protein
LIAALKALPTQKHNLDAKPECAANKVKGSGQECPLHTSSVKEKPVLGAGGLGCGEFYFD